MRPTTRETIWKINDALSVGWQTTTEIATLAGLRPYDAAGLLTRLVALSIAEVEYRKPPMKTAQRDGNISQIKTFYRRKKTTHAPKN